MNDLDNLREAIETALAAAREAGIGRAQVEQWVDYTLDLADENEQAGWE